MGEKVENGSFGRDRRDVDGTSFRYHEVEDGLIEKTDQSVSIVF